MYNAVGNALIEEAPIGAGGSVTLDTEHLAAGSYYVAFSGIGGGLATSSGSVMTYVPGSFTVPEAPTWAMMALGFVGLGYVAFKRAKRDFPAMM